MARKSDYEKALELVSAADKAKREQEEREAELERARALITEKEAEESLRAIAAEKVDAFIASAIENGLTAHDLEVLDAFPEAMRKRNKMDDLHAAAVDPSYWAGVPADMASMLDEAADAAPAVGAQSPCLVLSRAASTVRGL